MKRITLLAGLAAALALTACAGSPALSEPSTVDASASASAAGEGSAATVDINDPSRPMFGGGVGGP